MDLTGSCQAVWIGHRAAVALAEDFEGVIFGSTSRGVFLKGPAAQILFLSYEAHPGPLSINLATMPHAGRLDASPNQKAWVSPGAIRLLSRQEIRLSGASIWQPASLPAAHASRIARTQVLRDVARLALEQESTDSLTPLLALILEIQEPLLPDWQQPFLRAWESLRAQPKSSRLSAGEQLEAILGLGRGLTPSGDDFVCGLLLGLNRLAPSEQPPGTLEFSVSLVQAARRLTTALSAALIEAAGLGSADQRLVSAWDGLLCASLPPAQIHQNLSSYGSSSGIDALAGFAAASTLIRR